MMKPKYPTMTRAGVRPAIAELIPPEYDWVVAGGAAASMTLASDIDVWVRVPEGKTFKETCEALHMRLCNQFDVNVESWGWNCNYSTVLGPDGFYAHNTILGFKVQKLGETVTVSNYEPVLFPKPIQVMVVDMEGKPWEELLSRFDISWHQVAFTKEMFKTFCGNHYTPRYKPGHITNPNGPRSKERLIKFAERYGQPVDAANLFTTQLVKTGIEELLS